MGIVYHRGKSLSVSTSESHGRGCDHVNDQELLGVVYHRGKSPNESLGHQHMGAVYHRESSYIVSTNESHGGDLIILSPDFDTLSSNSVDSLREQVRQVYQRLDEVQKEVLKSKGEIGESSKGGSPFTPEI
ncbi:hypothetical protein BHM03_00061981 [Ensete ventricosum]|nr:hypothetical protein BHM03_00061981 [Ensete ventricosum]